MKLDIEAHGIAQGYGRRTVVEAVNLALGPGVHGLLGPNGAGKTTLLTTLATVMPPRQGTLSVLGRQITHQRDARCARREIGFLPQGFSFAPRFTVSEFLHYVAWTKHVPSRSASSAVEYAIDVTELGRHRNTRLGALSGGTLQRAGIAQALVNRPRILILDEPTVGLDPQQRLAFRVLITGLADCTVFLSTHLVEDVSATCATVHVMHGGRIVFGGTPDELSALEAPDRSPLGAVTPLERGYLAAIGVRSGESVQ